MRAVGSSRRSVGRYVGAHFSLSQTHIHTHIYIYIKQARCPLSLTHSHTHTHTRTRTHTHTHTQTRQGVHRGALAGGRHLLRPPREPGIGRCVRLCVYAVYACMYFCVMSQVLESGLCPFKKKNVSMCDLANQGSVSRCALVCAVYTCISTPCLVL
jgi:hypothetical protein